jgi:hypothetical protein
MNGTVLVLMGFGTGIMTMAVFSIYRWIIDNWN